MCGIAGFTWRDEKLIAKMSDAIRHRGPDQHGYYCDDHVSLGHRRLSIIDLTENGRQPMANEDGNVQVVFNGEIYNFQSVRQELLRKGHVFRSNSDTEVIVHGYEEWGTDCIQRFQGMFAFAVWDLNRRRLWLARDRIGIKPLYYSTVGGRLRFASEIKALVEDPTVPRRLHKQALFDYLGFEFVPAPETMFEDVLKLPAGHTLVWENSRAKIEPYWDLSFKPAPTLSGKSPDDWALEVQHLLDSCVKSHLISDVPLGVFLSGGLDSSALVALMRKHIPGALRTFTIGYPDKSFSELEYAKVVADYLGTEHHVLMIEGITEREIEKSLWHLDEPMTDLSSIPLMLVCAQARQQITVCLSGEGGDEVFAGYDRFKASKFNRLYNLIPGPVRRSLISPLIKRLPDQAQKKGAFNVLKRFVEGSDLSPDGQHLRWQYFLHRELAEGLFKPEFRRGVNTDPFRLIREAMARCDADDPVNRELYLDTRFMMTDSVLMKVDKMSMASSLEVRVPLLDHTFVELNAGLPGHWKLKGYQTKHLFRKALHGLLPDSIIYRGKQGYSLPVKNLLRVQLKDYMIKLLNESPIIKATTNEAFVNRLIEEHLAQKHNHNHVLWGLMNTALWHRSFNVSVG